MRVMPYGHMQRVLLLILWELIELFQLTARGRHYTFNGGSDVLFEIPLAAAGRANETELGPAQAPRRKVISGGTADSKDARVSVLEPDGTAWFVPLAPLPDSAPSSRPARYAPFGAHSTPNGQY